MFARFWVISFLFSVESSCINQPFSKEGEALSDGVPAAASGGLPPEIVVSLGHREVLLQR